MARGKQLEAQEKELERISSEMKAVSFEEGSSVVNGMISSSNGSTLVK